MRWYLTRLKWASLLVAFVLLIIIVFQNLEPIKVTLLFATVTLPQAALLTIALLVGFFLGLAAPTLWKVRSWQKGRGKAPQKVGSDENP
jgi:uncharacterized integral membrane protein